MNRSFNVEMVYGSTLEPEDQIWVDHPASPTDDGGFFATIKTVSEGHDENHYVHWVDVECEQSDPWIPPVKRRFVTGTGSEVSVLKLIGEFV